MGSCLCCWYWCQQPRPLTATELLVAASFNTAVRRISRVNSDDSLDGDPNYNTFIAPPPTGPCPTLSKPYYSSERLVWQKDDKNNTEMMALVKPLQRHQEQVKISTRFSERDTLQMASKEVQQEYHSNENTDDIEDYDDGDDSRQGKSPDDPYDECFGSIIVSTRRINDKSASILLTQLRGVPWVGSSDGLSVEVKVLNTSYKAHWVFLPNAKGAEIPVQREVTVKLSKHHTKSRADDHVKSNSSIKSFSSSSSLTDEPSGKKNHHVVLVTVWSGCRDHPRYSAIGHALVPLKVEDNNLPRIIGLFGHTKIHDELGSLEVSLISSSVSSSRSTGTRGLLLKVLRSHGLVKPNFHWIAKKASKTLHDKDRTDVWCSIALWIAGEKVSKEVTTKMPMPLTCDPNFAASYTFFVPKQEQHRACIVIKVHCGRSIHEVTIGRLVLGPLLYLGTYDHPPLVQGESISPRPVTLSHWGRSLNTHYPVTAWHRLRL
ncbi:uncharacterized protein LOC108670464 isoform X2 [Hyalella azteca]|uniref:Uncharacterized protein LOC108670464 isoform X2 n=1 Tax=Hyalella azteca TaxID=294128 RepID=A0A8B7NIH1_HYAAZ|nr:uncharacterized protein LOC108670464 isoform X2 [Hyalella azteca]